MPLAISVLPPNPRFLIPMNTHAHVHIFFEQMEFESQSLHLKEQQNMQEPGQQQT